jgi:hypothetical protein
MKIEFAVLIYAMELSLSSLATEENPRIAFIEMEFEPRKPACNIRFHLRWTHREIFLLVK